MAAKKKSAKKSTKKTSKKVAKKTAKRAGGRPKKGEPTKADFIRAKLAEGMSASDIIKAGADAGMTIAAPQVYKLKAKTAGGARKSKSKTAAASAPKAGKPTASNFIRQHPDKSAGDIVKLGAAAGLKFGESSVYQTRAYDKKKGGAPKGKPGRKPAFKEPVFKVVKGGGGGDEATFKRLAYNIGFDRARQLIDELQRGLAQLIGG